MAVVAACGGTGTVASPTPPAPEPADTAAEAPAEEPAVVADAAAGERADEEPDETEVEVRESEPRAPPKRVEPSVPVHPNALLPRERIVAFYGNPASSRMGILGELPPDAMLQRLDREVAAWRSADPATPVRPALQIIAVMATGDPGTDSLFRLRMPDWRIAQVEEWAASRNALLFLDVQPGRSSVRSEVPELAEWLSQPNVHLALDPEWSMPPGGVPGKRIGSMTADDINFAVDFLADLVERHDLPPKILVVHRFTQDMIRDAHRIRVDPRVQVVINMDGWGPPSQKVVAYRDIVAPEAEQFTGFKLFFHNDRRGGSRMLTPVEILELDPAPIYIQYQ
jgi:hypothetical protein